MRIALVSLVLVACGSASPEGAAPSSPPPSSPAPAPSPGSVPDAGMRLDGSSAPLSASAFDPSVEVSSESCANQGVEMTKRVVASWDACYAKVPKRHRLGGLAQVEVYFDEGVRQRVQWLGTTGWGPRAARCMLAAVEKLQFPRTDCYPVVLKKVYAGRGSLRRSDTELDAAGAGRLPR